MRKIRIVLAAALVAVFVLGALNVSVAGQRDRLKARVTALTQRADNLEQRSNDLEQRVRALEKRTSSLSPDGTLYAGSVNRHSVISQCDAGEDATWIKQVVTDSQAHLGC